MALNRNLHSAKQDLRRQKEMSHYGACVNAWIANRSEFDKRIMLFAAAGVGYLLTETDRLNDWWGFALWALAGIAFAAAIWFSFTVLRKNADYIESLLNKPGRCSKKIEKLVARFTRRATWCFLAGVAFSAVYAIWKPLLGLMGCS